MKEQRRREEKRREEKTDTKPSADCAYTSYAEMLRRETAELLNV